MSRFILVHDAYGVFLAIRNGNIIWSNGIPEDVYYNHAVVFTDRAHCASFFRGNTDPLLWPHFHALPCEPDFGEYASVGACVKAGAPCWNFAIEGSC